MQPDSRRIISDLEALKVYFDPTRKRIAQLLVEPRTIHQVADRLEVPFTRLYYHFNLLEKHGIIHTVGTIDFPGAVEEKLYQVTAYQFVIDRALTDLTTPEGEQGLALILSTVLDVTRENIVRSVRAGAINLDVYAPDPRALLIRRGGVLLNEQQAAQFSQRIIDLLTEITAASKEASDESRQYEIGVAFYPVVDPPSSEQDTGD